MNFDKYSTDFVIYHSNCCDGFGSAFSVWKLLGNQPKYYAATHGRSPPEVTNKNVVICDFSYDFKTTTDLIKKAKSLIVIDHHKSAEENLKYIDEKHKIFDMEHSGAYLTWKFFHSDKEVPLLIKYIEDRDIWNNKLPFTHEVASLLQACPFEFVFYDNLLIGTEFDKLIEQSKNVKQVCDNHINSIIPYSRCTLYQLDDDNYYLIALVNSNLYKSELGNLLISKKYPKADFAVVYNHNNNNLITTYSLRSTDNHQDVSYIAKMYKGGGHRNASGVTLNGEYSMLGNSIGTTELYNIVSNYEKYNLNSYNVVHINYLKDMLVINKYIIRKNPTTHVVIFSKYYKKSNITKCIIKLNMELLNSNDVQVFTNACNKPFIDNLVITNNILSFTNHIKMIKFSL
jgi:oligoribonuclease NrnB/cAMP/cGMP phosphodiesterase (DHH superfamily)